MPYLLAAARRARLIVLALFALALVAAAPAQADGTPDLKLSGGPAASVLYGNSVPVDLTASLPAGAPKGYNLAYRVVLPAGVSYTAGSAGALDGEPRILANQPTTGKTTLLWDNVDDLVASSSHTLSFSVTYNDTGSASTPKYDVGDVLPIDSGAYISTQPRDETDWSATGTAVGPGAGTYTGKAEQSTNTSLTPIKVTKSEPSPEGEIKRGVHDQQTVYSLKVQNNGVNPTNGVSLEDYLPAGLEFLGCAGTTDHTTNAPTNPGSAQEYPGSGPIKVTHPTVAEGCVQPDLVETVNGDPDGSGPLPAGVYTHVKWNNIGDFAKDGTKTIRYAAAIPIRENTMDWNGSATGNGTAPAITGAQTSNLDNNSGPETYDEQPLLNGAIVTGTYQAPGKAGKTVSDEGTLLRTAEDIAIQKSNDNANLTQGDLTKWTVDVQVSEYRSVTDLVIRDTVPNGLCPLGAQNHTTGNSPSDAECAADAAHLPSSPYTSVTEQADGTFAIVWDKTKAAELGTIAPNGTRQITFYTRTRSHYQANFEDSAPIRSNDSVENKIDTQGNDWIISGSDGKKIDADEADGTLDFDVSGSGKSAVGPDILKQVAATYPSDGDCSKLTAANYGKSVPAYGPGDQVCWKLRLTFPQNLNTDSQDVFDVLPAGIDYVPGTWKVTAANNVTVGGIDTSQAGRLHWPIGNGGSDVQPGQVFEVTFKTTVGSPLGHHSGDVEGNLMKFSYENTAGTAFTLRDRTDFKLSLPELALVKGVRQINGTGTVFGPNTDHKQVMGGDSVEYRVDVTNNGTENATGARVWDILPTGIACTDVSAISDGGTCNALSGRIEWSGIALAKAASKTLTYKVAVPVGVSPDQTFVNTAGVVEFTYTTNDGHPYQLIPANDVVKDTSLGTPNTWKAQDVSDIYTAASTIVKTRTTSVTESGNTASQATIGEVVDYTVTTTIPKGTTMYGTPTVVDALGARQTLVAGSLCATACTLDGVTLPAAGVSVAESPANTITATFPATYANTTGHDVALVLRFSAKVLDVAANTRGTSLPNTARLTFKDQLGRTITHDGTVSTTIVEPKVALAKSHTPSGRVSPGQLVDFTVKASNGTGTNVSTAHDVVVVDTLPAGTDPVDASGNPIVDGAAVPSQGGTWNQGARTITWTKATTPALAAVAPGASVNLTYKVKVESPSVAGQIYLNKADETTTSLDGTVPGIRTSTATSSTAPDYKAHAEDSIAVALPTISKTVAPDPITIGNEVVWHVAVTLPKDLRYFDTTVVDTVPDGFDVDSYGTATCVSGCATGEAAPSPFSPVTSGAAGTLQAAWYVGDLPAASSDRVYDLVLKGHLRDTYRNGGAKVLAGQTLTNGASVNTNRTDKVTGTPATVPTSFDDTVSTSAASKVVEPKLTITKAADKGPYVEGKDHVTYTVTVKNTGTSPAYDLIVEDKPDVELENVVLSAGVSTTLNTKAWSAGDHQLRWVVPGPIAAGDSVTFTYTADVLPATSLHAGDTIVNTASIAEYYGVPKATRDAQGHVYRKYTGPNSTVTLNVALPDLKIVKTPDNGDATAGTASSFTIKVTNSDTHATAHNVVVRDELPTWLTYPGGATAAPSTGFSETSASTTAPKWKIASLAPGASVTITLPVFVDASTPAGTTLTNWAYTNADEVPVEKKDDGSLKVKTTVDLQVTKTTDHDPVVPGTNIVYTMVTKNNGPSDAQNSTLVDTLPSYLTFVSVDDTHCLATGQTINCDFGTLAPGASRTIHVTVKLSPSQTAPIKNTVDVATTTPEPNKTNNHAEAPNTVKPTADVSIRKTADGAVYKGGDTVTYSLVAHNDGPSDAQHVSVDDDIPAGLTFVSVSPGSPTCTQSAGHVHCDVGTLAPGADKTVTIVTKAKGAPAAPAGPENTHKITVGKAERAYGMAPGTTQTWDVTCDANGIASDGSVQVQSVDQGTGTPADVQVLEAHSTGLGTYRFTVKNNTTGQAQVKLFVTCLPHDTDADTNTHPIDVGSLQTLTSGTLAPGRYTFTIPTSGAHRAIAPGIEVLSGKARLVGGEPDGNGWKFTVEVLETAKVTLSIRSLSDYTGMAGDPAHLHGFTFQHIVRKVTVQPNGPNVQPWTERVECPVGYKGIVATYDLPEGIVPLGNEPQPINRDFRLWNETDHPIEVTLDLECISIETGPSMIVATIVNTATVGTITFDPNHGNDTSSATIGVERAPGPIDETPGPDATPDTTPIAPPAGRAAPDTVTPPETGTTPGTGTPLASRLVFGTVSVAATGATAAVPVTCSGTATCRGKVTLTAQVAAASARSSAKTKRIVLGTATYTAKAGKRITVTVKIAKRYRAIAKSGRVRSVAITAGKTTATKKVVVLKKKSAKKS